MNRRRTNPSLPILLLSFGIVVACGGGGLDDQETRQASHTADAFTQSMQLDMWDLAWDNLTPEAQQACGGSQSAFENKAKASVQGKPDSYAMGELVPGEGKTASVDATLTVGGASVPMEIQVAKTGNVRWNVTGFNVQGDAVCAG